MTRARASVSLLAATMALLAACSSSSSKPPTSLKDHVSWQQRVVTCLKAQGWNAIVGDGGGIQYSGVTSQQSAYNSALNACEAKYQGKAVPFGKWTDSDWHELYRKESATAQCLRALGAAIPPIPSYQTFVQRYQSPHPWTSYEFVDAGSQSLWTTYNHKCPQPSITP